MKIKILSLVLICIWLRPISAQVTNPEPGPIFADEEVPRIDITIDADLLEAIFDDPWSYEERNARFIFTSSTVQDTVENIGFRLRGNTSRGAGKKSYKISFNTFEPGRKFYGLEKMNINGEHNDPSIVRSKMCWDIYNAAGVPASRSNHVALYINEEYAGLYTNVEHIDEQFVKRRFTDGSGNLWKCLFPATLEYLGFSPEAYKEENFGRRTYDLKTNKDRDDYSDLAHFVNVLNNYQGDQLKCELERIFDVDNYLRIIALDVLTSNWDGHIPNKNNFYLYHDPCTNRINFISYDLDNTFGIDWFGTDWTATDMYDWSSLGFGEDERPLYDRLMAIPEYRARYSHYMTEIIDKHFDEEVLNQYLDEKLELLKPYRLNDPVAGSDYGWSYQDFIDSYEFSIGDHVKRGMKEYIPLRVQNIEANVESSDILPSVKYITVDWTETEVRFNIDGQDDVEVANIKFFYTFDGTDWIENSLDVDENGDATYVHQVDTEGIMTYYTEITDDTGQQRNYPLCMDATERLGFLPTPALVINEIVASNNSIEQDEFEEFEDWIELYNASGTVLPVDKFYLTDDEDKVDKWNLPSTALSPNQYLIIWADDDSFQGDRHANFKLNKSGEYVGLYDSKENHFALIEEVTFPELNTDESYARKPNGTGAFEIEPYPTFGYNNNLASSIEKEVFTRLKLMPNPTADQIYLDTDIDLTNFTFTCIDMNGKQYTLKANDQTVSIDHLPSGVYTLLLRNEKIIHSKKFIIQK